jgi:hypothetical protein
MGILISYDEDEGLLAEPCKDIATAKDLCAARWNVDTVELTDDGDQVKLYVCTERGKYFDAMFLPGSELP